jgi:hypothetical protein
MTVASLCFTLESLEICGENPSRARCIQGAYPLARNAFTSAGVTVPPLFPKLPYT